MSSGRSSRLRLTVVAVLGLLLSYVVSLPPHLVHHAFEEHHHHEHDQPPCPYLALGQQTAEAAAGATGVVAAPDAPPIRVIAAVADVAAVPDNRTELPRGPPFA